MFYMWATWKWMRYRMPLCIRFRHSLVLCLLPGEYLYLFINMEFLLGFILPCCWVVLSDLAWTWDKAVRKNTRRSLLILQTLRRPSPSSFILRGGIFLCSVFSQGFRSILLCWGNVCLQWNLSLGMVWNFLKRRKSGILFRMFWVIRALWPSSGEKQRPPREVSQTVPAMQFWSPALGSKTGDKRGKVTCRHHWGCS